MVVEPRERFARWFASPASVLIILPALVVAVGVVVLLLGRKATHDSAETMARHQCVAQAEQVRHDVDFTLDQADPVLASMRLLAESTLATPDAMQRLHDVVVGRPGIANASVAFPIGVMWGTYVDKDHGNELRVQETRVSESSTARTNYSIAGGVHVVGTENKPYDPRTRPHYQVAVAEKHRVWMPPHTFSSSHKTGLTVTEPIYGANGTLTAVITIDFDVEALSTAIGQAPIEGARTVVFTSDGTILAYPQVAIPAAATDENRVLKYRDFADPELDAMFAALGTSTATGQRFLRFETKNGGYLASIAGVGGKRAGTAAPVDWFLATLIPEHTLFGATRRLGRDTIIASSAALLIALGVALMFAWNLIRMRRAVGVARAEAKSAQERAKQLGSYRLVSRLGEGGMGEVWRAEHQLLARQAAIKLVRNEVLADPAHAVLVRERFRREAQTLASLRSRHTIELYDYGVTDDGSFFFVMELLEGLDLSQLVREHGPQPAARVISVIAQACASLAEAHDAGLLHRDIKPANLFLCRAADEVDIIKLLDFGIAHNVADPVEASTGAPAKPGITGERLTVEGVVVGTPGYIPPEQAVGATLDARGDLYALGCVAWWLLTGAEVYPDVPGDDLIRTHVLEPVPELRSKVRGWLPVELEVLVLSCLAKRPEERPRDARALAEALAEIPIPAEHAWTRPQALEWWKNRRASTTTTPDAATVVPVAASKPDAATAIGKVSGGAPPAIDDGGGRLIVPQRDEVRARDERTVTARPSGRIP